MRRSRPMKSFDDVLVCLSKNIDCFMTNNWEWNVGQKINNRNCHLLTLIETAEDAARGHRNRLTSLHGLDNSPRFHLWTFGNRFRIELHVILDQPRCQEQSAQTLGVSLWRKRDYDDVLLEPLWLACHFPTLPDSYLIRNFSIDLFSFQSIPWPSQRVREQRVGQQSVWEAGLRKFEGDFITALFGLGCLPDEVIIAACKAYLWKGLNCTI